MNPNKPNQDRHIAKYKEAGLAQISAWVPPEDKARILAECKRLRELHLAKALLTKAGEAGPSQET